MEVTKHLLAFNRGVISRLGLARIDLDRMAMSAATQKNFMPRVLGSMMLRPGLGYIDSTNSQNFARMLPFTFGVDDNAMIEMGQVNLKVRIDDVVISRPSISSTMTNGGFGSALTGWTDASETGGNASAPAGYALLNGDGTDFGIIRQTITVSGGDQDIEHSIIIDVEEGPVRFKCGTVAGEDDYIKETRLDKGLHSLAFVPTGNFTVELANERAFNAWIDSCDIEPSGSMDLLHPYVAADLPFLRWAQSGDVIYLACKKADGEIAGHPINAHRMMKIERRGTGRSWSIVDYLPEDGPFKVQNVSGVTITASALIGDTTLTASQPIFTFEHARNRSIFSIASQGQTVTKAISGADDFTGVIRVVGAEAARVFTVIVEGTFSATVTLQFGFSADGPWNDTSPQDTSPVVRSYDDGQDSQIIYYRLGVKSGDYTSGTVTCTLTYTGGSITGIARCRFFTSSTVMQVQVLSPFGSITAARDWSEGEWSSELGYATSVSLHEGRLWWAGKDKIWGSISDAFESFDDSTVGDSAPISRSIGSGPIRIIHWLISMGRLMFGTSDNSANVAAAQMDGNSPLGARSNSFDEPLTPTNFNIKTISSRGVFVDRTEQRIYELIYDVDQQDYRSVDLSVFAPDFNEIGITQIAVQMKPDIRIHCVRADGSVGVLVYDRLENVICWITVQSTNAAGMVEDVAILPGKVEDQVYYIVKRTINSLTERHICKWALESQAIGGTDNRICDSHAVYSGSPTTTPFTTELLHLRDELVVVWADGVYVGDFTVSATGALTLTVAASDVIAGISYNAQFKSAKLGDLTNIGLLERKHINQLGFIAENLHHLGLEYGPDFNNLSDLPQVEKGQVVVTDTVHTSYHEDSFPFGGEWNTDSRICLKATAPKPCTLLAVIAEMESVEKSRQRRRS